MKEMITLLIHISVFIIAKVLTIYWLLNISVFLFWMAGIFLTILHTFGKGFMLKSLRKKNYDDLNLKGFQAFIMLIFIVLLILWGYIALAVILFLGTILSIFFIYTVYKEKKLGLIK